MNFHIGVHGKDHVFGHLLSAVPRQRALLPSICQSHEQKFVLKSLQVVPAGQQDKDSSVLRFGTHENFGFPSNQRQRDSKPCGMKFW
jgi:hypothetical protein